MRGSLLTYFSTAIGSGSVYVLFGRRISEMAECVSLSLFPFFLRSSLSGRDHSEAKRPSITVNYVLGLNKVLYESCVPF